MLETTRIRKEGYAVRPTFGDFLHRYQTLTYAWNLGQAANAGACRMLLQKAKLEDWQIGKTKVGRLVSFCHYLSTFVIDYFSLGDNRCSFATITPMSSTSSLVPLLALSPTCKRCVCIIACSYLSSLVMAFPPCPASHLQYRYAVALWHAVATPVWLRQLPSLQPKLRAS
jgi:hypothetical protein